MADTFMDMMNEAEETRLRGNVASAAGVPSSNAVTAFRNAPLTGEDPNLAMADPAFSTGTARANRNNEILARSEPVRSLAAKGPAYVAATQEDWDIWSAVGDSLQMFSRAIASAAPAATEGLWGTVATTAAAVADQNPQQVFAPGIRRFAERKAREAHVEMEATRGPVAPTWVGRMFQGAAQSVGINAPGMIGAIATRNPAFAIVPGAAVQGGLSGLKALEKGKSGSEALLFGATDSAAEIFFERIPVGHYLKGIEAGTGFGKLLLGQMFREVSTEVGTTLAQNFNEWRTLNPEKPLGVWLREQPEAIRDTIAQTIISTGMTVGGIESVRRVAARGERKEAQKAQAEAAVEAVKALSEQIASTKTHAELPQLTEAFLAGTPVEQETVWVDGETIAQLHVEGHTPFKGMENEIGEALIAGRDVAVPMSKFLADVSGQPFAEKVFGATRFSEDGVSVEEAGRLPQERGSQEITSLDADTPATEITPLPPRLIPEDLTELLGPLRALAANVEGAVDEVFADQAITELFEDNKALKLSKGSFARYDNMLAEAKAAATERVLAKVYAQIRAERAPEWKDKVNRERATVEDEVWADPAMRARQELQYGEGPRGEPLARPGVKLSRAETVKAFGASTADALPRTMFGANGEHPDDVAELFGYDTGQELLSDLLDLEADRKEGGHRSSREHVKALVEDMATERARAALGFDLSPEGIMQAAREAAVVPQIEDYLDATMRDMAQELGLPFNKAAVQFIAALKFAAMRVGDGINVRAFERGMWKTGERARRALEKGDWAAAFIARQQQLLNFYQLEMAHDLGKKFARSEKQFARFGRKKTIKGMAQSVLNHIHAYLPRIAVGVSRDPYELMEALDGSTVETFVDDLIVVNPVFPAVPTATGEQKDMLVGEWRDVRNFLTAMARYGREVQTGQSKKATLTSEETTVPLAELIQRAAAGAPKKGKPKPLQAGGRKSLALRAMEALRGYNAAHRVIDNICEDMDATDTVFNDVVEDPMQIAADTDSRLRRVILKPFVNAFWKSIPAKVRGTYGRRVADHTLTFDGRKLQLRRGDLVHIAFRVGTQDSLEKFAAGYNTTPDEVLALLERNLTQGEVDFVQAGWDAFEELSPTVSAQLRAMRGVGLEKVPAREWTIGGRTVRGGYWPIDYDRKLDRAAAEWDNERYAQVGDEMDPEAAVNRFFAQITPTESFSYARRNHIGPMTINLNKVLQSFDAHIKYAAYARTIASVRRFINDPFIKQLVVDRRGEEYWKQFNPWLDSVVLDYTISDSATAFFENWAKTLRINSTIATLGFSFTTGVAQAGGIPNVIAMVDNNPAKAALAWTQGLAQFNRALLTGQLNEVIFNKSEFMRQRFGHMEANMAQATDEMHHTFLTNPVARGFRATRDASLAFIGWVEFVTVTGPGWIAAYNTAVGKGKSEKQAALWADKVIRRSQGSGRKVDLAAIQRGSEFMRFLYRFNSFFIRQYNAGLSAGTALSRGEYGKAFSLTLGFFVVAPLLGALLTALTTDNGPDWEEPEEVAAYFASAVFFGAFRGMFLAGDVANVAQRNVKFEEGEWNFGTKWTWALSDTPLTQHAKAVVDMADSVWRFMEEDDQRRPVQTWANGISLFAGLPLKQPGRIGEYALQVQEGDQNPEDAFDVFKGIVSGPQEDQE